MKALVIGCEGFIGWHCTRILKSSGYEVVGCDLFETGSDFNLAYKKISRLSPEWDEIFTGLGFDICLNAGGSGNVPYSLTHPLSDFEANALDVFRLLDAIRKFQPACKYVHISSAAVYGNPSVLPVTENAQMAPLSPYGYHKWVSEILCQEFCKLYGLRVCVVRPFSVYGNRLKKQLLWDICTRLQQSSEIELSGTGNESRDFIHVSDLVALIDLLVKKASFSGEVYNAACGREVTIRHVAQCFENHFGGLKRIRFSGVVRVGDPLNWQADIEKIEKLGYTPKVTFEQGLVSYIDWFQQHMGNS